MKKTVIVTGLILALFFSSCGKRKYEYGGDVAYRYDKIILDAIKNDQPEKIKKLFCKRLLKSHDEIDEELDEFIHFMDGDIAAVGELWGTRGMHSTQQPYGLIFEEYQGEIDDIFTEYEHHYKIVFSGINVDREAADLIGIMSLSIIDLDKYEETGNYKESRYSIYLDGNLVSRW